MQHVSLDHGQCWQCLPCTVPGEPPLVFPTPDALLQHTRLNHADDISQDIYPTLITESTRSIPSGISQCPLCDSSGPPDSPLLLDHIAEHIHSFALRSLPWPKDDTLDEPASDGTIGYDTGESRDYFDSNDYFEQGNDDMSKQYNIFSDSERDSDGLASLLGSKGSASSSSSQASSNEIRPHKLPYYDFDTILDSQRRQEEMQALRWKQEQELRSFDSDIGAVPGVHQETEETRDERIHKIQCRHAKEQAELQEKYAKEQPPESEYEQNPLPETDFTGIEPPRNIKVNSTHGRRRVTRLDILDLANRWPQAAEYSDYLESRRAWFEDTPVRATWEKLMARMPDIYPSPPGALGRPPPYTPSGDAEGVVSELHGGAVEDYGFANYTWTMRSRSLIASAFKRLGEAIDPGQG